MADLLERLGYENTHWHINDNSWQDYSGASVEEVRGPTERFTVDEPAHRVVPRILAGQFALSHLGALDTGVIGDTRVIVVVRDIRWALPSWCRWIYKTGRWTDNSGWREESDQQLRFAKFYAEFESVLAGSYEAVYQWIDDGSPFVRFEDLVGNNGNVGLSRAAATIAAVLEEHGEHHVLESLRNSLDAETPTNLEGSTGYEDYWSRAAWFRYQSSRLPSINQALGYANRARLSEAVAITLRPFLLLRARLAHHALAVKKASGNPPR